MNWRELQEAAPELARAGRERLDATRVALLATLRRDGSPRISPVEPYFSGGQLLFGAMSWSRKAADLRRDPRCVLHSAVTGPDNGEGELKLYGRTVLADEDARRGCKEGWWHGQPADAAVVFVLDIEETTYIDWDLERGELAILRYEPRRGLRRTRRAYP